METLKQRNLTLALNLVVVAIVVGILMFIGSAGFVPWEFVRGYFIAMLLSCSFMFLTYTWGRPRLASLFFSINLLLPIGFPLSLVSISDFNDDWLFTLFISCPLLLLIIWNYRTNRLSH